MWSLVATQGSDLNEDPSCGSTVEGLEVTIAPGAMQATQMGMTPVAAWPQWQHDRQTLAWPQTSGAFYDNKPQISTQTLVVVGPQEKHNYEKHFELVFENEFELINFTENWIECWVW